MLETGTLVQTPYAVGRVKSAVKDRRGDWVIEVEREADNAVHAFYLDCITPHRIYEVGEIVHFSSKDLEGYGEIIYRFPCGHGRQSYEIRIDGETNTVWASIFQMRELGSLVGKFPAWDSEGVQVEDLA